MNKIMNIIASHFAIVIDVPAIAPNPNKAATNAITRKTIAQLNNPPKPFLFILLYR